MHTPAKEYESSKHIHYIAMTFYRSPLEKINATQLHPTIQHLCIKIFHCIKIKNTYYKIRIIEDFSISFFIPFFVSFSFYASNFKLCLEKKNINDDYRVIV